MQIVEINPVSMVTQGIRGIWIIYGLLGVRQYLDCTEIKAVEMYKDEYKKKVLANRKKGVLYNGAKN